MIVRRMWPAVLHSLRVWTAGSAMAMLLALGLCTLPGALPASAAPNVSSVLATTDTADPAILSSRPAPHTEIIIVRSTPATAAARPANGAEQAGTSRATGTAVDERSPDTHRPLLAVHGASSLVPDGEHGRQVRLIGSATPRGGVHSAPLGRRAPPHR